MNDLSVFEARSYASCSLLEQCGAQPLLTSITPVERSQLATRARETDPEYAPGSAQGRLIGRGKEIEVSVLDRLIAGDDAAILTGLISTWRASTGRDGKELTVLLDALVETRETKNSNDPSSGFRILFDQVIWPWATTTVYTPRPLTFPPAVFEGRDPLTGQQGHLSAAPAGIGAVETRNRQGDRGKGCRLVDVEQGWRLGHEDLVGLDIELIQGRNVAFHAHGTNTLGVIAARDNDIGGVGIAPGIEKIFLSSENNGSGIADTANAILAALPRIGPGDVILIESQALRGSGLVPVEFDDVVYEVIRLATALGVVVIEPAGNGGQRLDGIRSPTARTRVFDRSVRDSGAVLVGAASATVPHLPLPFTNTGARLDCFAWGEDVITTGGDAGNSLPGAYNFSYGGTSAAAAILAGVALVLQGIAKNSAKGPLAPKELRKIVSEASTGTESFNPRADQIGVMPDLKKILEDPKVQSRLEPRPTA